MVTPLVCLNYLRTDRGWSVYCRRKHVDTMNAGDENDRYVGFFRCYSYQGLKRNLQTEMKIPASSSIYNYIIFFKLRQNNPMGLI